MRLPRKIGLSKKAARHARIHPSRSRSPSRILQKPCHFRNGKKKREREKKRIRTNFANRYETYQGTLPCWLVAQDDLIVYLTQVDINIPLVGSNIARSSGSPHRPKIRPRGKRKKKKSFRSGKSECHGAGTQQHLGRAGQATPAALFHLATVQVCCGIHNTLSVLCTLEMSSRRLFSRLPFSLLTKLP